MYLKELAGFFPELSPFPQEKKETILERAHLEVFGPKKGSFRRALEMVGCLVVGLILGVMIAVMSWPFGEAGHYSSIVISVFCVILANYLYQKWLIKKIRPKLLELLPGYEI